MKNDNANGIVELSASAVSVPEPHSGSVVNVTRTAGDFGTVSEHELTRMIDEFDFPNYLQVELK